MKKILLAILFAAFSTSALAQIQVVDLREEADTLLTNIDFLQFYHGSEGYMIEGTSTNTFDSFQKFYLAKTIEESIDALKWLASMCDKDVATKAIVKDGIGKEFRITTVYMMNSIRTKSYRQGDRIAISNDSMAGIITIKKRTIEQIIEYLENLR